MSGRFADSGEDQATLAAYLRNETTDPELPEAALRELVQDRLASERFSCELRTLSEVIAAEGIACIDLLKVDVEKSELDVLLGVEAADWARCL